MQPVREFPKPNIRVVKAPSLLDDIGVRVSEFRTYDDPDAQDKVRMVPLEDGTMAPGKTVYKEPGAGVVISDVMGSALDWHTHKDETEVIGVIYGRIKVMVQTEDDGPVDITVLMPSDPIIVPKNTRHRVEYLDPSRTCALLMPSGREI